MTKYILITVFSLFVFSCSSSKQAQKTDKPDSVATAAPSQIKPDNVNSGEQMVNDDYFIKLSRTACFGKCPIYTITIKSNGDVSYFGKRFVDNEGLFSTSITPKEINQLKAKIEAIQYFKLEDAYDSGVTDIPSTITSVKVKGKVKHIKNRHRGPAELREFEKLIDQFVLNKKMTLIKAPKGSKEK